MSMRRSPELTPSLWDGVIVLGVVLLAAGSLLLLRGGRAAGPEPLTAVVTVDGREADRFPLTEGGTRTYTGGGVTLEVCTVEEDAGPGLRVVHSDCPTQDCVRTGVITSRGQSIVCLPARISIRLEGGGAAEEDNAGVDAVIG